MFERPGASFAFTKLVVQDLEKAAAFYRAVCGYGEGQFVKSAIAGRSMEEIIVSRPQGGAGFILLAYTDGAPPPPSEVITGFNTNDIDAFQARVLAAGGSVVQAVRPFAAGGVEMRFGFFADPEGSYIEVIER